MKAVRLLEYGGQLVFNDVPTPTIARDEILVKINKIQMIDAGTIHEIGVVCDHNGVRRR